MASNGTVLSEVSTEMGLLSTQIGTIKERTHGAGLEVGLLHVLAHLVRREEAARANEAHEDYRILLEDYRLVIDRLRYFTVGSDILLPILLSYQRKGIIGMHLITINQ